MRIKNGIVVKPNGELRMSFDVFRTLTADSVYKHLVKRAK